ncbi:MAG: ATP-binding cassette domain-containing protein [Flavobacteriaceae bacterium]|nr:ATP-binding cassette domain-containing protein [Flavobacteriaceae bacterium]
MLVVKNLEFSYPERDTVLEHISFAINPGDHCSIMGSSGCGKSSLLKVLYGLLDYQGEISYKNQKLYGPIRNLVPGHDFMKYVSQDFELMPYTTVSENIGQHLSVFEPKAMKNRIRELLQLIDMEVFANTKTAYLSGGQKQRVALAKALAQQPEVLLLDEPFGHIDSFKKNELRRKLFRFVKKQQITTIVATHDKEDVLPYADQVLVLKNKSIWQMASPQTLYTQKPDWYTASLFGDISKLEGLTTLYYPEELEICTRSTFKARVTACAFMGSTYLLHLQQGNNTIYIYHHCALPKNELVYVQPKN